MSLSVLSKNQIKVDTTVLADGDSLAAYLTDAAGNLLTSTLVGAKQSLDTLDAADKAEDDAHASGDMGQFSLAVRRDTPTSGTSADGDYASFNVNASGELYTHDGDVKTELQSVNTVLGTIDTSLNNIETDTGNISTNTSTIAGDTTSIDSTLTSLAKAEDVAHVSGDFGMMSLAVRNDTPGSLVSADGDYAPLQVDANGNLRVAGSISVDFSYDYAEDAAASSGDIGAFVLAVRQDSLASSTSADGDYAAFKVNAAGELYIHDTDANASLDNIESYTNTMNSTLSALSKAEDAAHVSGDQGVQVLAVRKDAAGSNVSADGDYASLVQWSNGELKVVDIANSSVLQAQVTVGTTAVALPASPLANRKSLVIQNTSSATIFIGSATVTTSGATVGIQLLKGGSMEIDAGPSCIVYAIAGSAGNNIAVLEMA